MLTLCSVRVGWVIDDHFHRLVLTGRAHEFGLERSPFDIFRFFEGRPELNRDLIDRGFLPWWTEPDLRGGFWRPATVVTHWLDYKLWPNTPTPMHLHSVLWYAALILVVGVLLRSFGGSASVAGLAALFYAVDDAHGMPVGFLANRNALIATLFGVLALLVHDRWRRLHWKPGAILAPMLFVVCLLAKEGGIGLCAYLFAYAVYLDRGPWRRRLMTLLPYLLVVVAWRLTWTQLGYGMSAGMELYIDPGREPLRFLMALVERLPVLFLGLWGFPPSDLFLGIPRDRLFAIWLPGILCMLAVSLLLRPICRRDPKMRFWFLGMVLSMVPVCAAFPSDRLLLLPGIGAMALLAAFVHKYWLNAKPGDHRWLRRLAVALTVWHLGISALGLPLRTMFFAGTPTMHRQLSVRVPFEESVRSQTVVLVNPPSCFHVAYLPIVQLLDDKPIPEHVLILGPGYTDLRIDRTDDRTLVVRPEHGFFVWVFDRLFRSPHKPLLLHETIELSNLSIQVTELTPDGRPAEVSYGFNTPLENNEWLWLKWLDGEFVPFTPPATGEYVELPRGGPELW